MEFLQCVFMNDFEDLRNKDPWKVCIDMKCEYIPKMSIAGL